MIVEPTGLEGVMVVRPAVHGDDRGFFLEALHDERYRRELGPSCSGFKQLNHSRSRAGTLRGLHFQEPKAQGKLVWALAGAIFDVVVDVRRGSPTFARWVGVDISAEGREQIWVPPGFAHGFVVRSDHAECMYACTEYYAPECERAVRWDDPAIGVDWCVSEPVLSGKDAGAPLLAEQTVLPVYEGSPQSR